MFRRLFPYLTVAILACIDTSVIPVLTNTWLVPLLAFTACIAFGLILGPLRGSMIGLWGGLLFDSTCAVPFGLLTTLFIICSLLSGFAGKYMRRNRLASIICAVVCLFLFESVMLLAVLIYGRDLSGHLFARAGWRLLMNTVIVQAEYLLFGLICREKTIRYETR